MSIYNIAKRCLREIRGSTSLPMLRVAYRYYRLFFAMLVSKNVPKSVIKRFDEIILKVYKNKKRKLEEL